MSGYPEYNFPLFRKTAEKLRQHFDHVIDPSENFDGDRTLERKLYMRVDAKHVLDADAIVFLPGWSESVGCNLEAFLAQQLELPAFLYDESFPQLIKPTTIEPIRMPYAADHSIGKNLSILQEAEILTTSTRRATYGHPLDDYTRVSDVLSELFKHKLKERFVAEEMPMIMIVIKLSRELYCHKRDNRVDIAGYANVLELIVNERAKRSS